MEGKRNQMQDVMYLQGMMMEEMLRLWCIEVDDIFKQTDSNVYLTVTWDINYTESSGRSLFF